MDIGLITEPFGIKGEVRIRSFNDEPERFRELERIVVVDKDGAERIYEIETVKVSKNDALVKLDGVLSRNEAEKLKGNFVRLGDGDRTEAENESVFRDAILGIEVYTRDGTRLGVLEEVIRTGANDVYEIRDGEKSVLIPAIDDVIIETNLDSGRMIVDPLPGLL
ncbi:MAG: ribosome maturation factor RimM [bacterium]